MWLLFRYNDSRLAYSETSPKRPLILGQEGLKEKIWLPHVILRNEKDKAIMGLARKDIFISISPSGEVIYSYRMSATIYCWMNLRKFPFDTQSCTIEMISCRLIPAGSFGIDIIKKKFVKGLTMPAT